MVYLILGEGFEEIEAVAPCDILRRGGLEVSFAAVGEQKTVTGAHGIILTAETFTSTLSPSAEDVILIPGGMGGVNSILADEKTMHMLARAAEAGAKFAAICAGPAVLAKLRLLDGRHITCYPGTEHLMGGALCDATKKTCAEQGLMTGRAPGSALDFGLALLAQLKGEETAEKIKTELVY